MAESTKSSESIPSTGSRQSQGSGSGKAPIVIAIDTGKESREAFDWFIKTMYRKEHDLLLVYVAQPPFVPSPAPLSSQEYNQMLDYSKQGVYKVEEEWIARMKEMGVGGRIKALFHFKPGEAIVEAANENNAAAIVMGCRGLGKLRRTIMGSVSDYVLHHVHCPVVIYKADKKV